MPFVDDAEPAGLAPQIAEPLKIDVPVPSFGRLFDAAMSRENTAGSIATSLSQPRRAPFDASFDPWRNIAGYEDFAGSFIGDNDEIDVMHTKTRIDDERRRQETLDAGGWRGILAGMGAGYLDPVNLIPFLGQARIAARAGRVVEGAVRVGATGALSQTAIEGVLQSTQIDRSLAESGLNIAGNAVLGAGLGAVSVGAPTILRSIVGHGAPSRAVTPELADRAMREAGIYERELAGSAGDARPIAPDGSIGAAAVRDTTLEQETFISALGAENALARTSPTLRLGTSPSVETRRIGQELADQPLDYRKNLEGIETPISVERRILAHQGPLAEALVESDNLFVRYRMGRDRQVGDIARLAVSDLTRSRSGALSADEFREAVGMAMRRGDASDIPEVAEAARTMRARVFDPLKDKAIAAGLLPEDVSVDTALSYFTRVYNTQKIAAQRPRFEKILTDWLATAKAEVADRVAEMQTKLSSTTARREKIELDLSAKKARQTGGNVIPGGKTWDTLTAADYAGGKKLRLYRGETAGGKPHASGSAVTGGWFTTDPAKAARYGVVSHIDIDLSEVRAFARGHGGADEFITTDAAIIGRKQPGLGSQGAAADAAALRGEFEKLDRALKLADREHRRLSAAEREAKERLAQFEPSPKLHPDDPFRLDPQFRESTPANRARAREMALNVRKATREAEAAAAKVRGLQAEWDKVRPTSHTTSAEAAALKGEIAALEKELPGHITRGERLTSAIDAQHVFAGMEDIDLQDIARQITDTLLHAAPNRTHYTPVPLTRGPLRERTLSIQDKLIEDFLESDVNRIAKVYTRTMAADTELATAFGRADMEQQLDKVREHYAVLREGVTDERKLKWLNGQMHDDLRYIAAVRDRVRGTYGLPDNPDGLANRAFHVVRDLNYLRLMGGMTLSAIPDLGRTVMTHGLTRVVGDGIVPMLRGFREFRLAANEAKLASTALDMVLDTRSMSMADMLDDYGRWSKYERGIKGMTDKFGLVSLMALWNSGLKQFVGVISQTRSLQAIEKLAAGSAVSQVERTRLASLGIGEGMIPRIASEFKAHGEKQANGTWWANTAAWTDRGAADDFRAALSKEIDIAIVTPGQERPLWMSSSMTGKLLGQFKGFAFSSTQRVMLSGLQKRDMATLNGAIMMVGLGMLSYAIRQQINPKAQPLPDPSTPEGVARWVREGVDRSGLTGWIFEAHNMVEKASGGNVGLGAITGGPPMSRYASRSAAESILGPTFGTGINLSTKAFNAATTPGDWSASDTSAVRQMIPFQNLFTIRRLFDEAEHGLNQALGVPERP